MLGGLRPFKGTSGEGPIVEAICFFGDTDLNKVHEDVSEALHVVSPALLDAEVGVDAGVPGGACKHPFYNISPTQKPIQYKALKPVKFLFSR